LEKTIAFLEEQRGLHFESRLVTLFLEHLEEILEIKKRFAETANEEDYTWISGYQ